MRRYLPLLIITLAALAFVVAQASDGEASHRCRRWREYCGPLPTATATAAVPTPTAAVETRDPRDWPFAADSIWNMPIGSGAQYIDAQLDRTTGPDGGIAAEDVFLGIDVTAPVRQINGHDVHVPPGMSHNGGWTGCSALLAEDGLTALQGQPLVVAPGGQPQWQYNYPAADLTGDGRIGCHGGSGLSGIGGTIRAGELDGAAPIRHALKVNLNVRRFVSCEDGGYRWPAIWAHGYMSCQTFGGTVPAVRLGALLAVLPDVDCDGELSSGHARKMCHAMQDYGAYVVNDASLDVHAVNVAYDAEFGDGDAFVEDMQALFGMLHVVDNNSAISVGGGGTPRMPLAPAFADESGGEQPPVPTNTAPAATNTSTPATDTPVVPTATRTNTPVPSVTPTPTSTSIPAAPTATPTLVPATATPTRTSTPNPATATPTRTPSPVPPTATFVPPTAVPATATATSAGGPPVMPGTRDKYLWPFASTSIWNMPIGSAARYVPAGLAYAGAWNGQITRDDEYIGLNPSDPLKRLNTGDMVHVPPSMDHDGSWNGCATFLMADGEHLAAGQPLRLSEGSDPSWQYDYTNGVSLYGDGRHGCHGASALSGVGGSLRVGELNGPDPIRHALKVNVFAQRFLSCTSDGYRWPAYRADAYMDCGTYGGGVTAMRMGSLLAVLPSVNCDTIVASRHARKLCHAFQDYGAYVVDDTFWDVHAIDLDVNAEFGDGGSFHSDMQKLFQMLHVVDNNGPGSMGGGGTPRAPLAPPIGN